MNQKNPQKNNLKLRPFVFLAFSMMVALFTLVILDTNKASEEFKAKPTLLAKHDSSSSKRKARGKKEFVEFASVAAEKDTDLGLDEEEKGELKIASPSKSALKEELDKQLENAQDLVDTGEIDSIMKAKEILEKILAEDPNHDASIKELAMIYLYDLDEPVRAQELLQRSYNINPEDPLVFSETLQLASENGMVNQFLGQVREKLASDVDNPTLNTQVARVYSKSGDHLQSGEHYAIAAHSRNSSEDAYQAGLQFNKAGQKDLARQHMELSKQLIASNPKLSDSQKKTQMQLIDSYIKRL